MTIIEFIKECGCTCFDAPSDGASTLTLPSGQRVTLHAGIACHTNVSIVRGAGPRPKIARRRRPWLRARRRAMRATGQPPRDLRETFVLCHGCGTRGKTTEHLEGAF